jgi:hypothetical protein
MNPKPIYVGLALVVLAVLACNAPQGTTTAPPTAPPTVTPYVPAGGETPLPPPTVSVEGTVAPTSPPPPSPTPSPSPAPTSPPPPTVPPTQPSAGPLDFNQPTALDGYRPLAEGGYEVTLMLHITGGAPPFTIRHDVETFQTSQRDYPLVFRHSGCSAIVHTITITSADGQTARHDYWIGREMLPWCGP